MRSWILPLACVLAAALAVGCTHRPHPPAPGQVSLKILSSPAQYVSGGNARVELRGWPAAAGDIALWLNGRRIDPPLRRDGERIETVVTGLVNGANLLEARPLHRPGDVAASIRLTNHPITGPMFTGPQQLPFICRSEDSGLGQPLVDNQQGIGHPVRGPDGRIVGHSRFCAIAPTVGYFYFNGDTFRPFNPARDFDAPPADLRRIDLAGASVPFVVRVEAGTINRFIYTIAMLAPFREAGQRNDTAWNRKLIYWMRGGNGIGRQQGLAMWFNDGLRSQERSFLPRLLEQGYAVATSSGNDTTVHLNMRLAEETAMMTKEHFVEAYGNPRYTIGMGLSGGAIQQYLFAQNRPGLLDAGVPMQSYPDMITQITQVSDCQLLEQYFADEVRRDPATPWARWSARRLVEGMNASDTVRNPLTGRPGSTECVQSWLLVVPTLLNPRFRDPQYDQAVTRFGYPPDVFERVTWTHWSDLANIYGLDAAGYAPDTIDNVGVQYGLRALANGAMSVDEFLRLNACVGGWKEQRDFVQWAGAADPFDSRNMLRSASCRDPDGMPAPRRQAAGSAVRQAWDSGHVFTGRRLDIPLIDVRTYLEAHLDMHESRQAFAARARLLDRNRRAAANQVIWISDPADDLSARGMDALAVLDRYLGEAARPARFADACFDAAGTPIAEGAAAWSGILDPGPAGACTGAFPIHTSPRIVAGDTLRADVLQCRLKPVARALLDGTYPPAVRFSAVQRRWLERIFPRGVCDYSREARSSR